MRFTIFSILNATMAVALILAFDRQGFAFGAILVFAIPIALTILLSNVFARAQLKLACVLSPTLYLNRMHWMATVI